MKVKSEREVAQSCPTLSDPMDCGLPGSSVHGIFQARVLEWGAIAFSIKDNNNSYYVCRAHTYINVHAEYKSRASKYGRQRLIELQGERDKSTVIDEDFNTHMLEMNRSNR